MRRERKASGALAGLHELPQRGLRLRERDARGRHVHDRVRTLKSLQRGRGASAIDRAGGGADRDGDGDGERDGIGADPRETCGERRVHEDRAGLHEERRHRVLTR